MPPTISARERLSASVRLLRTKKGISGDQFARDVGISRNTLFLIENKAANASLRTIERLAHTLGVEPASLLDSRSKLLTHATQPGLRSALPQRAEGYLRELVASNIAHYRQQKGLTQQALVQAAGMADGYVSLVERTAPDLGLDVLERFAQALHVSVRVLLATP
ncbi:helix-turn-helix domain-containing protein [Paraburkholderia caledonica]|uniref:helix-turn-helix domain-containing protein n=1 Tax=Paraburkholderia caledonica TaxID=134536 RepID=UPI0038BD957D